MKAYEKLLKEKILKENVIPKNVVDNVVHHAESSGKSFLSSLLEHNLVDEGEILDLLAGILSTEFIDLEKKDVSEEVLKKIPAKFAWHYQFIPISLKDGKLTIAVNVPLDTKTQDEIELITGLKVSVVLAKQKKIKELLKNCYGLGANTIEEMVSDKSQEMTTDTKIKDWDVEDIREKAGEASVIKLVNQIIAEAYNKRATDIHIEPYRGKIRLRYRIDGVLFDQYVPDKLSRFLPAIISRIKIMSNLNIVERRIPQDGRALVRVEEQVLDLRISIVPTPHGESVVIRILPTKMFFNLEGLGLSKDELVIFDNLLKKPNGIVFVTGPTGSGKTTTLYACLRQINSQENKIISIEDPIEYEMKDVIQIQVNPSVGLTFAQGLRSMLRHDPDIMMVGEVRDKETAEIAVRVALTGHLVLSTLHTNDAPSSITRLIDIGIEPYLLASSVEAFVAQRLIRVICPQCKEEINDVDPKLKQHIKSSLGINEENELHFFKGRGCEKCNFTGFYGRTAVYEILLVDKNIRDLIKKRSSAAEIRKNAINSGMKTILQDCWRKVIKGITTVEEALRLSQDFLAEMEVIDAKTKKSIPEEEKQISLDSSDDKKHQFDFEDKRLHKRNDKKINIQFKLVDKSQGEILKIKDKEENGSEYTNLDSFFGDNITTNNVEDVYQGVSEVAVNVSEGGALFRSQYSLPVGSILEINLKFPNISKSIDCLAKVVRVEKELPVCFFIAVCFMDVSGAERKVIKKAITE